MKEIRVVVGNIEEVIEGENLHTINRPTDYDEILVVMDGDAEVAVFHKWVYWKKVK